MSRCTFILEYKFIKGVYVKVYFYIGIQVYKRCVWQDAQKSSAL